MVSHAHLHPTPSRNGQVRRFRSECCWLSSMPLDWRLDSLLQLQVQVYWHWLVTESLDDLNLTRSQSEWLRLTLLTLRGNKGSVSECLRWEPMLWGWKVRVVLLDPTQKTKEINKQLNKRFRKRKKNCKCNWNYSKIDSDLVDDVDPFAH